MCEILLCGHSKRHFLIMKDTLWLILAISSLVKSLSLKDNTTLKQKCQILCIFQYLNVLNRQGTTLWSPKGQGAFPIFKIRAGCSPLDALLALPLHEYV